MKLLAILISNVGFMFTCKLKFSLGFRNFKISESVLYRCWCFFLLLLLLPPFVEFGCVRTGITSFDEVVHGEKSASMKYVFTPVLHQIVER